MLENVKEGLVPSTVFHKFLKHITSDHPPPKKTLKCSDKAEKGAFNIQIWLKPNFIKKS